jgi:hypothetical protein
VEELQRKVDNLRIDPMKIWISRSKHCDTDAELFEAEPDWCEFDNEAWNDWDTSSGRYDPVVVQRKTLEALISVKIPPRPELLELELKAGKCRVVCTWVPQ